MSTHDKYELPPLPYPQIPGNDYTAGDMREYASAAIEAYLLKKEGYINDDRDMLRAEIVALKGTIADLKAALQSQDMNPVIEALEAAQNNECGPRRPFGSGDPNSDDYDHGAFMWDYYQRAIDRARGIKGDRNARSMD